MSITATLFAILQSRDINLEANTLYPMLRRLEEQGLASRWDTSANRPRKYYILSKEGYSVYLELLSEWKKMQRSFILFAKGT